MTDERVYLNDLSHFFEWEISHAKLFPFELFLYRNEIRGIEIERPRPGYRITFGNPVSFSYVDLSRTSEYIQEESDCPPVLEELPYDGSTTFVAGFTYHAEAHGPGLRCFHINTPSEVFEVLAYNPPTVTPMTETDFRQQLKTGQDFKSN